MSVNETRTSQFGLVSGIRQSTSELITIAEPENPFGPEARKGRLYIVAETQNELAKSREICQQAANMVRKAFYDDPSLSITASLRAAARSANKALHQKNFNIDVQQRTYIGLTCAVIKGKDLFVAQIAPAQMYILAEGKLRALPAPAAWSPAHLSAAPFLSPQSLGKSLFIEPELYRSTLNSCDTLALCSSNIAALLRPEEIERILRYQDPTAATESIHTLCRQHGLAEAHALIVELLPPLSLAARTAPLSPLGLSERGQLLFRGIGDWFANLMRGAPAAIRTKNRSSDQRRDQPDPLTTMPEQPDLPTNPIPKTRPIDLGASLDERYQQEQPDSSEKPTLPPSTFLGEGSHHVAPTSMHRSVSLSDPSDTVAKARPYRPRHELRPLVDMSWWERLTLPLQHIIIAVLDMIAQFRRNRLAPPSMPSVPGRGLSYRRQSPPFPWIPFLVTGLLVTILIFYGLDLSRRSAQNDAREILDEASDLMAAVYEAPDDASALTQLQDVDRIIGEIRANSLITETNAQNWARYVQLQSEYERAQAELQRITFFESPTILAEHPQPNGRFVSIVVPQPTSSVTDTAALEAQEYIYALDGDEQSGQLYRIPRSGGAPELFLSPDEVVQRTVVGSLRAQAWRVDNIVAVDQGPNGFGYYFRTGEGWNHTRLGGSEVWAVQGRLDLETYRGNLYAWGAQRGEILRYKSGQYGNPPELWLDPAGLDGRDVSSTVDMAVDGNIYLLQPTGNILVLFDRRIIDERVPGDVSPPLAAVTRFFVTGPQESGWIFLVDTLNERIIQLDKLSGEVIQQMLMPAESPIRLNQLTDLYVDDSGSRPVLYIVNSHQIIRVDLPAPPRPFVNTSSTPSPEAE